MFKIDRPFQSERKLSQAVIQVSEQLGMYNAELARILGQQCGDIGELTSGRHCLQKGTHEWQQAILFIDTYHLLFDYFDGDAVAMYHWMRASNNFLHGTPHFLIVDEDKLQQIHDYLKKSNLKKANLLKTPANN